jgi:L-lactate dehydrogenase complex protein LldE
MPDRSSHTERPHVGLLVTCLVDAIRPSIGFATLKLLEASGCRVTVPETQTCCGQPALNSGALDHARDLAKQVIAAFEPYDYLVGPSGSCVATVKLHYAELLGGDPEWGPRQRALAAKSHEILSFLHEVRGWKAEGVRYEGRATYHDTCSGLRGLGIKAAPRALLAAVDGLDLVPLAGEEACCGFGGTFCVKYPEISTAIVTDKVRQIRATGADTLLAADLGCLMNMAGRIAREGDPVRVFHTVEVLAGMADGRGLCDDEARAWFAPAPPDLWRRRPRP